MIYAGTPEFAVPALEALLDSRHRVQAVYTQPDRPAGRGRQLQMSAVKQCALRRRIPVEQPPTLRDAAALDQLAGWSADRFRDGMDREQRLDAARVREFRPVT